MLALIIFIIVVLIAAIIFIKIGGRKITGGAAPKTLPARPRTMLFNGMGDFHYWLVQERLAQAGFVNLEHPDVIEGNIIADKFTTLPPVDYLRLDVGRFDTLSSISYSLLRIQTKVVNRFERESRFPLVVKHMFHERMRGRSFYPRAIDYEELGANLDRVWITRPSLTRSVPGMPMFFGFKDIFIIHDNESLARAQKRYAELAALAPTNNPLRVSVAEYIAPALIDGHKFSIMMYLLAGKGTKSVCSINRRAGFLILTEKPYKNADFDDALIHYPTFIRERRKLMYLNDAPGEIRDSILRQLDEIEIAVCKMADELKCPSHSRAAYEIFNISLLLGEDGRLRVIEITPRAAYIACGVYKPAACELQSALADWEAKIVLELFSQIDT